MWSNLDTSPAVSTSSNAIELLDCDSVVNAAGGGGGKTLAAQENCEMHLLTTSATGETSFGGGITGS